MKHEWQIEQFVNMDAERYVCQKCGLALWVSGLYLMEYGPPDDEGCSEEFRSRTHILVTPQIREQMT